MEVISLFPLIDFQRFAGRRADAEHRQLACVISKNDSEPHQIKEPDIHSCGRAAGCWRLSKALQVFEKTTQQSATVGVAAVTLIIEGEDFL